MGQYYKPVSIEKNQHVYSYDYGNGLKLMEHSWVGNDFVGVVENLIAEGGAWHGDRIVWAGDYADPEPGNTEEKNLYQISGEHKIRPDIIEREFRFVVNNDAEEFVDKTKIPLSDVYTDENGKDWPYTIHPLPILTCEGNGRGDGDFHKQSKLVGKWARNRVSVSDTKPEGYKEIKFNLYEGKRSYKQKSLTI